MRPETLLPILIGGAIAAGGILQSLKWRHASSDRADELASLREEVELLKRENTSLRSLAQGGGEIHIPQALIDFASRQLDLEFHSSPVVHQIAPEELRDRITASVESGFPPNGLADRELAWSRMGLISTDDRYAPQLAMTRSLNARSWFDPHTGEAWVTDQFDADSVPDQGALLRAITRILLSQHYPAPNGYPGDESDRARTALHHGTALAIENRFMARQALSIGFTGTQDKGDAAQKLLESLPPLVRNVATFPSQFGLPHAQQLIESNRLTKSLHAPPTVTAAFESAINLKTLKQPIPPDRSDEPLLEESAGFLGLRAWLITIDPAFADLAVHWRGDLYQLFADEKSNLDLIWTIELDSKDAAATILEIGEEMVARLSHAEGRNPQRRISFQQTGPTTLTLSNLSPVASPNRE